MHSVYLLSHRHGPPHSPLPVKAGAIRPDSDEGRYALRTIKDSPSAPPRGERYALKCIVKRPQYKVSHSGGRNIWCLWNISSGYFILVLNHSEFCLSGNDRKRANIQLFEKFEKRAVNFTSYSKHNIWELQLSNGNLNMNDKTKAAQIWCRNMLA